MGHILRERSGDALQVDCEYDVLPETPDVVGDLVEAIAYDLCGCDMLLNFLKNRLFSKCRTTCSDSTYLLKYLDLLQQGSDVTLDIPDLAQDRIGIHYEMNESLAIRVIKAGGRYSA